MPKVGRERADYGLDAPAIVRGFLILGVALLALGFACLRVGANGALWGRRLGSIFISVGVCYGGIGALMWWSSRVGKLHARDHLLDRLALRGDERLLDVGCGRGLLLIGAAKRLPRGEAVGLDLWSQVDQGDNSREATLNNARAEGVADRIGVEDGDMCAMPFTDAKFDVVVSNLAIHNVRTRAGRQQAIHEIVRVLAPGGQFALMDMAHTDEYAEELRAAGACDVRVSGRSFWIFPSVRVVTGVRSNE